MFTSCIILTILTIFNTINTFMTVRLMKQSMSQVTVKGSSAKAHYQYINYKGTVYRQPAEKKISNTEFGD